MTDFLTTLKELREKATAGVWMPADYSEPSNMKMIWDIDGETKRHGMCIECVKENDAALIVFLVNHADKIEALVEALEPFADCATDRSVDAPEWRDEDFVPIRVRVSALRRAMNALSALEEK